MDESYWKGTPNVEQGVFAITFKTRGAKTHIESDWKERNEKGELNFTIVQEEQQEAEQSFVLGKIAGGVSSIKYQILHASVLQKPKGNSSDAPMVQMAGHRTG